MRVEGKVALITGAASGIGLAMVEGFREAGARVLAADLDADRLAPLQRLTGVHTMVTDMGDPKQVDRMVDAAITRYGGLHILCNNAGRPDRFQGAGECTDEEWERGLAVNLTGPFLASRRAIPIMLAAGGGVIINTASVAGLRGGEAGVAYTAAKHGLIGLTRSIAAMYGEDGIRCVAICPGPVTTGMTRVNAERRAAGLLSPRGEATARKTAALRWRWAEPREIAELALFVASDQGKVLNGCAIPADSGRMVF